MHRQPRTGQRPPHLLMLVENQPLPDDRRVWLECRALRDAGYRVTAICPAADYTNLDEHLDGIRILRFPMGPASNTPLGFATSYAVAWAKTARLARRVWKADPFDVLQANNPPDTYFLLARAFQRKGVKFLFDQHDLSPEVYATRFANPRRSVRRALALLERLTHRTADHVITVNESCRELLLTRTPTSPDRLTVVRTGADLEKLKIVVPQEELRRGKRFLCSYLGIMGPQDGVEMVLRAAREIIHVRKRRDIHFALMGFGECLEDLRGLAREWEIDDCVTFTGRADSTLISAYLSSSDIGLQPDPKTEFTELCSMIKTIEYMAFGLPVAAFDLRETRRTAADAATYVTDASAEAYSDAILGLLDDPTRRARMSAVGRSRSRGVLAWENQQKEYIRVVDSLVGSSRIEAKAAEIAGIGHVRWAS